MLNLYTTSFSRSQLNRSHWLLSALLQFGILLLVLALGLTSGSPVLAVSQIDIVGPNGSGSFGSMVTILPNGNFLVVDPYYDIPGGAIDVGAVYLYDGITHTIISTLTGSTSSDRIGNHGVITLSNGNYVIISPNWSNGNITEAGAVTWGSGTSGVSGIVTSSNSLVGNISGSRVSNFGVVALSNGNYVVRSPLWNGDFGAITWGNGTSGVIGHVGSHNSLVGSTTSDRVGTSVVALSNGNYVVASPYWDSDTATNVGAVTWGNGTGGVNGVINSSNSLVGATNEDRVGYLGAVPLSNGNYIVGSPYWSSANVTNAGAVTWGDGNHGVVGEVNSTNSLIGSTDDDWVGNNGVTVLTNDNYVIRSPNWDNGNIADAGAVTWGSGKNGVNGVVSNNNSLVGSTNGDMIGIGDVVALSNGHYVVVSHLWDNDSVMDAGAVTWGNGTSGIQGVISNSNSLVGNAQSDWVGLNGITTLASGNYLVISSHWDNGDATMLAQ